MTNLARITRLAGWLYWAATVLLPVLPLLVLGVLLWGACEPGWMATAFPGLPDGTALTPAKSAAVLAIGAVALVPITMALWQMRGLFARYRAGEILTPACACHIRRAGGALTVLALVQTVTQPLQILMLTLDNPPGARQLAIGLTSEALWLLLAGGLLVVIGWVMAEAAQAAAENAEFV